MDVRVRGEGVLPSSLQNITASVVVAGCHLQRSEELSPDVWRYVWNGRDVYGRKLVGNHSARVTVYYHYPAVYYPPGTWWSQTFARVGAAGGSIGRIGRSDVVMTQTYEVDLSAGLPASPLNGWSFEAHHIYDPNNRILYTGDAREEKGDSF